MRRIGLRRSWAALCCRWPGAPTACWPPPPIRPSGSPPTEEHHADEDDHADDAEAAEDEAEQHARRRRRRRRRSRTPPPPPSREIRHCRSSCARRTASASLLVAPASMHRGHARLHRRHLHNAARRARGAAMADTHSTAPRAHARAAAAARSGRSGPPGRRRARRLSGRRVRGAGGRGGSRSTGSPASRSARSTPRSSPATRPSARREAARLLGEDDRGAARFALRRRRAMARMDAHAVGRLRRRCRACPASSAPRAAAAGAGAGRRAPGALSFYDSAPLAATLDDYRRLGSAQQRPGAARRSARSMSRPAISVISTRGPKRTGSTRATSWPRARCRRACRRSRSTAPGGGTAASSPTRRSPTCSTIRRQDLLVFQVDLFPARGALPATIMDVYAREKDIRYSSRTRQVTDQLIRLRKEREAIRKVLAKLPPALAGRPRRRARSPTLAAEHAVNVVHLIYRKHGWEGGAADFEFSRAHDGASLERRASPPSPRRCATTPCSPATSSTARPPRSICARQ